MTVLLQEVTGRGQRASKLSRVFGVVPNTELSLELKHTQRYPAAVHQSVPQDIELLNKQVRHVICKAAQFVFAL